MLEYVHFIPGRLRLKISELRQKHRAAEAEERVGAIEAVKNAVANPLTGSLTITFDPQQLSIRDLWEILRAQGYVSGQCPEPCGAGGSAIDAAALGYLGRAVKDALLDAFVRHSAEVLVRALL